MNLAAIIAALPFAITTVEQAEELIRHLFDHRRTLEQSITDGDAADAELDKTLANAKAAEQP